MDKQETFEELKKRGIAKAVVSYSGGNDEGGADSIDYYSEDDAKLDLEIRRTFVRGKREQRDGEWVFVPDRALTEQEQAANELVEALEKPVYDQYGCFAGDYYVTGVVTWDGGVGRVVLEGNETVDHYEEVEVEF